VDPEVPRLVLIALEPGPELSPEVGQGLEAPAWEEVGLQVAEGPLHPALPLLVVRKTDLGPEAVVLREPFEPLMQKRLAPDPADHHRRLVVVEDDGRYPTDIPEGLDVALEQRVLPFVEEGLQVLVPTVGEDQGEDVDLRLRAPEPDLVRR